jgi:hypothetical protein
MDVAGHAPHKILATSPCSRIIRELPQRGSRPRSRKIAFFGQALGIEMNVVEDLHFLSFR